MEASEIHPTRVTERHQEKKKTNLDGAGATSPAATSRLSIFVRAPLHPHLNTLSLERTLEPGRTTAAMRRKKKKKGKKKVSSTVPENPIWAQLSNTGLSPKTHDMFARPEPKSRVKFAYTAYTTESFRSKGSPSCVVSNETFVKSHGCSTKGRIQSITWWTHQTVCDCLWGVSERVPFLPDKKRTQTHTHTSSSPSSPANRLFVHAILALCAKHEEGNAMQGHPGREDLVDW